MASASHHWLRWLLVLSLALPGTATATDWQAYQSDSLNVQEIDRDSVRVVDGLVHFRYRRHYVQPMAEHGFDNPIEAIADCATRRRTDVTKSPTELRAIFEETLSAYQLDFACRLAGLASNKPATPVAPIQRDWRHYAGGAIDANSVKVSDGLVFFDYDMHGWYTVGISGAVIDCLRRQYSEVVNEQFTLRDIQETTAQAPQAKLACELGHVPMTPSIGPQVVDFDAVLVDAGQAQIDDELYLVDLRRSQFRDGLVHFTYHQYFLADGSMAHIARMIPAVVDCAGGRRSDDNEGSTNLQPVRPGTRGARQVDAVCLYAGERVGTAAPRARGKAWFGAPAPTPATAKRCRYVRIDSAPAEWRDDRLRITGSINGTAVPMFIDTGAESVVVPLSIAASLKLQQNNGKAGAYGAGGVTKTFLALTDTFAIGAMGRLHLVPRVDMDSAMIDVLIGNAFLLDHDFEFDGHAINFLSPVDCEGATPAYGDPQTTSTAMEALDDSHRRLVVQVLVNGHALRALVDTGSPATFLDLRAARALGIDPVKRGIASFAVGGIGSHRMTFWVPQQMEQFQIGAEIIDRPRLAIAELFGNARNEMGSSAEANLKNAPDMILGADFLHAHRVLFARSQNRMYLSYIGGTVFGVRTPPVLAQRVEPDTGKQ